MTNEKQFETRVKNWLISQSVYPSGTPKHKMTVNNGWFLKVWGGGYQKSGIPDLLMCVKGVFMAVEIKSKTGKPSALQQLNIDRINEAGGIGIILYPNDFEDFKNLIQQFISKG